MTTPRVTANVPGQGLAKAHVYLTGKRVLVLDRTGRQIDEIQIPDEGWTASVSFGGQDRRTLFNHVK